nr:aromatic acid exporter family protein [Planococcus glaciei]
MMRSFHFNGSRILKTGIAIFLTAIICGWFGWPPVFAVITAIVTIEPTVSDSIKKGLSGSRHLRSVLPSRFSSLPSSGTPRSPIHSPRLPRLPSVIASICTPACSSRH